MTRTLDDFICSLPRGERETIEKRAAEMVSEEVTRRELSHARKLTKARMARKLHVPQVQISEIERSTDLHISTLRQTIEGMGGSLSIVAQFPEGPPLDLLRISADHPGSK